jgi:hypothetical protein
MSEKPARGGQRAPRRCKSKCQVTPAPALHVRAMSCIGSLETNIARAAPTPANLQPPVTLLSLTLGTPPCTLFCLGHHSCSPHEVIFYRIGQLCLGIVYETGGGRHALQAQQLDCECSRRPSSYLCTWRLPLKPACATPAPQTSCACTGPIDGAGGILGGAGPVLTRPDATSLPISGVMVSGCVLITCPYAMAQARVIPCCVHNTHMHMPAP